MKKALKTIAGATVCCCLCSSALILGEVMPVALALKEGRYHDVDMLLCQYYMVYGRDITVTIVMFAAHMVHGASKFNEAIRRFGFKV